MLNSDAVACCLNGSNAANIRGREGVRGPESIAAHFSLACPLPFKMIRTVAFGL
jgi:hypothetical protein